MQQETLGHRGFKAGPLYGIRRTLLTGAERLSPHGQARLAAGLDAGDPEAEFWYAHHIKELLRSVYRADDIDPATEALETFYDDVAAVDIPEIRRLGRTIRLWLDQVLAYWRNDGLSNGVIKAVPDNGQRPDQAHQANRPWLPQPPELPATTPTVLRRR